MSELLPVFGMSLLLAFFAQNFDRSAKGRASKLNIVCLVVLIILMATFVGLRTSYNDTFTYRSNYEQLGRRVTEIELDLRPSNIGNNPGYGFIISLFSLLKVSTQSYLMFYAYVTVGLYVWFLWKYSKHFCLSIFLLFTMGTYTFTMAAIKQCVAVAICLPAVSRALDRKWVSFVLLVLLAATFHPYALMFLVVPLMTYRPWSNKTYFSLFAFACAGFLLQSLLGVVIDITSMMGENYEISDFSGAGINVFRLLVCAVPLVLAFWVRRYAFVQSKKEENLIINLSMLNTEIMFVGLFGTANYFGRLANYFLIMQTIAVPWLLHKFEKKSAKLLTVCAVICYMLYFYYAEAVRFSFDAEFSRITLGAYLRSLVA